MRQTSARPAKAMEVRTILPSYETFQQNNVPEIVCLSSDIRDWQ
jgi:hypothetical protein